MSGTEENWLDGLCHYTGEGYDLPLGGYSKIPNWQPIDIVKRWEILDAESDEGVNWVTKADLKPTDILIGCEQNTNSINAIVDTYGRDFYLVRDANGVQHTLDEWQSIYHTNGLGLVAIRQMRDQLAGSMTQPVVINSQKSANSEPVTYKKLGSY